MFLSHLRAVFVRVRMESDRWPALMRMKVNVVRPHRRNMSAKHRSHTQYGDDISQHQYGA